MLQRSVPLLLVTTIAAFAVAPFLIHNAPYESTMGLVQKIFYFHAPAGIVMFVAAFVCGISSAIFLFRGRPGADRVALASAELTVLLGTIVWPPARSGRARHGACGGSGTRGSPRRCCCG